MDQDDGAPRRRLDHVLYAAEGVGVLGTAIFLIGFVIENRSHTPGRALEAAGFVVFGIGLFASAAAAHFLARHYAGMLGEVDEPLPTNLHVGLVPHVDDLITEAHEGDAEPTSGLAPEVDEPEDDAIDESEDDAIEEPEDAVEEHPEELAHPNDEQTEKENSSD